MNQTQIICSGSSTGAETAHALPARWPACAHSTQEPPDTGDPSAAHRRRPTIASCSSPREHRGIEPALVSSEACGAVSGPEVLRYDTARQGLAMVLALLSGLTAPQHFMMHPGARRPSAAPRWAGYPHPGGPFHPQPWLRHPAATRSRRRRRPAPPHSGSHPHPRSPVCCGARWIAAVQVGERFGAAARRCRLGRCSARRAPLAGV